MKRDADTDRCAEVLREHIRDANAALRSMAPEQASSPALPDGLSRKGRTLLLCALSACDDTGDVTPTGKPPSAMTTLRALTGNKEGTIRRALVDLVHFDLAKTHHEPRLGSRGGQLLRVRIHLHKLGPAARCEAKGCPRFALTTGRWCQRCKQLFGRDDRDWQIQARELYELKISPVRIAVMLKRPLYLASKDDGRDPNGGAVVPYLLGQSVFNEEDRTRWAERLREARRGASLSEDG